MVLWAPLDEVEDPGRALLVVVTVIGKLVVWVRAGQSVTVAAQDVTV